MRLLHKEHEFIFDFKENVNELLVVENPDIFKILVQDLLAGMSGNENGFVLSEENVPLEISRSLICIVNPFQVSPNERKILNKLYDILKNEIQSSNLLIANNEIYTYIQQYAIKVSSLVEWDLEYNEKFEVQSLLKFMDLKFAENEGTLLEKLMDYMDITHELLDIKCYVFINLMSFLNFDEIKGFYEFIHYRKLNVLLMENRQPDDILIFDDVIVIDKDSCEIKIK